MPQDTTMAALLEWTYRLQKADMVTARPLYRQEANDNGPIQEESRDGCAQVARIAAVGARIATTAAFQRSALHPDAEAVHDAVLDLSLSDPLGALLLWRHGRKGQTPDWGSRTPQPEPTFRRCNGREAVVEDATLPGESHLERHKGGIWIEVFHPFCPLSYWPSHAAVEEARLEYACWYRALNLVRCALPPLNRWAVTGPGAAEEPWRESVSMRKLR